MTLVRPFVLPLLLCLGILACTSPGDKGGKPPDSALGDSADSDPGLIPRQKYNIVLVVAGSLRAKSTSLVEGGRDTTPELANWAEDQVIFDNAITPSSWVGSSIASVFSGIYVTAHGLRRYDVTQRVEDDTFLDAIPTFPELLQEAGYRTAGLYKAADLRPSHGWGQGFDTWEVVGEYGGPNMSREESAAELTDAALAWLADAEEDPFFLYVHYMDSHNPYQAPAPWYDMFVSEGNTSVQDGTGADLQDLYQGAAYTTDDVEKLTALYEGEAAYWDSQFIRIPNAFQEIGLDENTILVVMSDHGQQLAEHDSWLHYHLWQENIHVPLVFSVPGAIPGRVSQQVSLVDLAPTLSALTGVPGWEAWQGEDLSASFEGNPELEPRTVFSEYQQRWAVLTADGWKAHAEVEDTYLHDLSADPLEAVNLRDEQSDKMTELTRMKHAYFSDCYSIRAMLVE